MPNVLKVPYKGNEKKNCLIWESTYRHGTTVQQFYDKTKVMESYTAHSIDTDFTLFTFAASGARLPSYI